MNILNNGSGITPKFVWMMDHSYWSIVIFCILICFLNNKPAKQVKTNIKTVNLSLGR